MALSLATIGKPVAAALFNAVVNLLNNPNQTILNQAGTSANVAVLTAYSSYSVALNATGWWNSGVNPSRLTPTVAGLYEFAAPMGFAANGTGARIWQLKKNGSQILAEHRMDNPDGSNQAMVPLVAQVTMNGSTDYVEFYYLQNCGGPLSMTGTVSLKLIK